jgi:hypothetical protein
MPTSSKILKPIYFVATSAAAMKPLANGTP